MIINFTETEKDREDFYKIWIQANRTNDTNSKIFIFIFIVVIIQWVNSEKTLLENFTLIIVTLIASSLFYKKYIIRKFVSSNDTYKYMLDINRGIIEKDGISYEIEGLRDFEIGILVEYGCCYYAYLSYSKTTQEYRQFLNDYKGEN